MSINRPLTTDKGPRTSDDSLLTYFVRLHLSNRVYTMGVKRLIAIAISVAALVAAPGLWAQRGGGGRSFGGGGRSFGGARPSGGFSGFRSSPSPVSRPGPSGFASVRRGSGTWQGFGGRRGPLGGGRYPGRRGRYDRGYGFGYGYNPFGYGYGFYPYGYIPSSLSYAGFPDDYQSEQGGAEAPPEDYGPSYGPGDEGEAYGGPAYPPYPGPAYGSGGPAYGPGYGQGDVRAESPAPAAPSEPQIPTVLVYRDGHQMEIQNYAIAGQTVWVFGDQITRKIALADLDVAKTKQLNDKRGVEFDVPESP